MRLRPARKVIGMVRSPEEAARRRIPWGKYAYMMILAVIAVSLARWLFSRAVYIQANGLVRGEERDMAARETVRVQELNCRVDDRVQAGDQLVLLDVTEESQEVLEKTRDYERQVAAQAAKVLEAESALALAQRKKENQEGATRSLEGDVAKARELLEARAVTRGDVADLERSLEEARREAELLALNADLCRATLEARRRESAELQAKMENDVAQMQALLQDKVLLAPVSGVVTLIHKQQGEVAKPGEAILTVADESKPYVLAYFPPEAEHYLVVGETVTLKLATGERTTGTIRRVHPRALPLPPDYQKRYGPEPAHLVAEVAVPEGALQGKLLGTPVKVVMSRRWIPRAVSR